MASLPKLLANRLQQGIALLGIVAVLLIVLHITQVLSQTGALLCFAAVLLAVLLAGLDRPISAALHPHPERDKAKRFFLQDVTRALIEALPDPCLILDPRGLVSVHNSKAVALIPALRDGDPGTFFLRAPELIEAIEGVLKGASSAIINYEEKVPLERWLTAHVTRVPLRSDGTDQSYACIVIHDQTGTQRTERMRVDFVANASHELRTPLASMLGFIDTLQGAARNDEKNRDRFLGIMRDQAQRMARLVDDLLSLSRVELNAHIRPVDVLDIGALVSGTIDALAPLAIERGVKINFDKPSKTMNVRGDRDDLIRVFENLIENAIKYGESGKAVDITAKEDGDDAPFYAVSVRDYGAGIPELHLPRLTERFYRVDPDSSREKGGTGLGLAIVKHILTRHSGELHIQSRLGEGSAFTVTLPKA